ncbi:hypothetical protein [Kribbella sp. NPDC051620]|uniref:DUF7668 domain-containing protein n=1 Tax=Kribbella sp. NPDC051620 TaxID=3364120 RepID=UPI0037A66EBA
MVEEVLPVKEDVQTAVPHAWRETLGAIVDSLVRGDVRIGHGIENVDPLSKDRSKRCRENVEAYGRVTLSRLPETTWDSSVARWQGDRWDCLVDLWTAEEGRSDLVLRLEVLEDPETAFRFRPYLVYVA